jgi:hypothetical protein
MIIFYYLNLLGISYLLGMEEDPFLKEKLSKIKKEDKLL